MRKIMFIMLVLVFASCSKEDENDCGCTEVQAGGFQNEGYSNIQFIKLCDPRGIQIDRSTLPITITNLSSEQLAARSLKDGCQ